MILDLELDPTEGDYVLTVKQPWASLIMRGLKDVENRTWLPKIESGQKIWIHSSLTFDRQGKMSVQDEYSPGSPEYKCCDEPLPLGYLLGTVIVKGTGHYSSPWAVSGNYQWKLIRPVTARNWKQLKVKGRLGLWRWREERDNPKTLEAKSK